MKEGVIPFDVFLHIASYLVKLSDLETKRYYHTHSKIMAKALYDTVIQTAEKKFKPSGFSFTFFGFGFNQPQISQEEYQEEKKNALERFQKRGALEKLLEPRSKDYTSA